MRGKQGISQGKMVRFLLMRVAVKNRLNRHTQVAKTFRYDTEAPRRCNNTIEIPEFLHFYEPYSLGGQQVPHSLSPCQLRPPRRVWGSTNYVSRRGHQLSDANGENIKCVGGANAKALQRLRHVSLH